MNKQSESPSASRRTTALVVLAVVLYWIWWDSFHEASRFYLAPPFTPSGSDPFYAYLSCFMRPVGIMAGCVAVLVALRTGRPLEIASEVVVHRITQVGRIRADY